MNRFNFMFGFENSFIQADASLTMVPDAVQAAFYRRMKGEFAGTELEEGLFRHWFEEFTPNFCTNAGNCGDKFFLLQSDGEVYSCVRGQGTPAFRFGNLLTDPVDQVLRQGQEQIRDAHQRAGLDEDCRSCATFHHCHTGCPFVKTRTGSGKSYTCQLQKALYDDSPATYPRLAGDTERDAVVQAYVADMHPHLLFTEPAPARTPSGLVLPNDLADDKNALQAIIEADPILQTLYSDAAVVMQLHDQFLPLASPLLAPQRTIHTLMPGDALVVHVRQDFLAAHCPELIRNTLFLQLLRDTPVVYGDEQRTKQEHLFTYQRFFRHLGGDSALGPEWRTCDLAALLAGHAELFLPGVANNLLVTTAYLRDYHYQKQRNNGFYHIQALNLPFQNLEFHWCAPLAGDGDATR
jgi:uncharacterized protein